MKKFLCIEGFNIIGQLQEISNLNNLSNERLFKYKIGNDGVLKKKRLHLFEREFTKIIKKLTNLIINIIIR